MIIDKPHPERENVIKLFYRICPLALPDGCGSKQASRRFFSRQVLRAEQRPDLRTTYRKNMDDLVEEYSAFGARNDAGRTVGQDVGADVTVCGIASEYCVRESVLDLLEAGRHVTVLADALGWVDRKKHEKNLEDLENRGAVLRWIGANRV